MRLSIIGIDLGKTSCSLVGLDAVGNVVVGKRDRHTPHGRKLRLSRHRPESIGRHPRKVSKSSIRGNLTTIDPCAWLADVLAGVASRPAPAFASRCHGTVNRSRPLRRALRAKPASPSLQTSP